MTAVNLNAATITDGAGNAANLVARRLTQTGPQIDTTTPTVSSVVTSGPASQRSGDLDAGSGDADAQFERGGDGGRRHADADAQRRRHRDLYRRLRHQCADLQLHGGAGQNTSDLAVTAVNLNAATITDGAGNAANLSGAVTNPAGTLQIDTTTPTVSSVVASGTGISSGTGDLNAGKVVTLTLNMSEAVTVAGGTPTLTLNDGGTATYTGGSGTNALTFSYTVGAGQNTSDLTVTAVNLNAATITDGAGNAANLTGAVTNPAGTLQIDTTTPTVHRGGSGTGITIGAAISMPARR